MLDYKKDLLDEIFVDLAFELRNGYNVLDIGCGYGNFLIPFFSQQATSGEVIGIDSCKYETCSNIKVDMFLLFLREICKIQTIFSNLDALKHRYPKCFEDFNNKLTLYIDETDGQIKNFQFEKNKFDVVIAANVLHFFEPKLQIKYIEKIISCARKGGLIYISLEQYELMEKAYKGHPDFTKLNFTKNENEDYGVITGGELNKKPIIKYCISESGISKLEQKFSIPSSARNKSHGNEVRFIFKK